MKVCSRYKDILITKEKSRKGYSNEEGAMMQGSYIMSLNEYKPEMRLESDFSIEEKNMTLIDFSFIKYIRNNYPFGLFTTITKPENQDIQIIN